MASIIISFVFHFSLFIQFFPVKAETWIRAGYWDSKDVFPVSSINSSLFTHLICSAADISSTSYQIYLSSNNEKQFTNFTEIVKQKNPSITTLLSIGGENSPSNFSSMANDSSNRKSFIDSSISLARLYGFQGLDLAWTSVNSVDDGFNMGVLLEEWRAATELEAKNTSQTQLILTARSGYSPGGQANYPVDSMQQNLNWVHVLPSENSKPSWENTTSAPAALYDPSSVLYTDYGIKAWIEGGLSADKLVLCLPFYGYAWTLKNPEINGIGAAATGPAITGDGFMRYKDIVNYIHQFGRNVPVMYNSTYAVNYYSIGTTWIGFNDVEAIRTKISYAKDKKLLGYFVWKVSFDKYQKLSKAAAAEDDKNIISSLPAVDNNNNYENKHSKRRFLVIILSSAIAVILLLGILIYYFRMRKQKLNKGLSNYKGFESKVNKAAAAEDFNTNAPNLIEYTLDEIEAATDKFSIENRLGEGGYGTVYKGELPDGQEIAVKKLSKTSTQGFAELKNEVTLTAKLQHVNLVRVLGFCIDKKEQILIYEYMPNKSLDYYLFDPVRKLTLDWEKRVHIIEGVTQGLLYLQEYSRLTVIHRDLKSSNVLLDEDMKPKISDFGLARIFAKEGLEANTERIAGTRGIVPPEYIRYGIYSTKFDVYSFGVLLLEIISGKRSSISYGLTNKLSLPEHAYETWKEGKGMEFVDPIVDDTYSSCKLMRCLQIALLCVEEKQNDRPSMLEVHSILKNETVYINSPKKPEDEDVRNKSTLEQEILCSQNVVMISEVSPR